MLYCVYMYMYLSTGALCLLETTFFLRNIRTYAIFLKFNYIGYVKENIYRFPSLWKIIATINFTVSSIIVRIIFIRVSLLLPPPSEKKTSNA